MRIDDELKTSKFQSDIQRAHLNVLFTAYWVGNKIHQKLKPYDLTSEQFNVLRIVRGQMPDGLRIKDITARMIEPSSNTTRIIDRLESRGWVLRLANRADRRERPVILTDKGSELLATIDKDWAKDSPHTGKITKAQAKELSDLLDILRSE
jgi:DNA-binding MarR family transcriptional regulator